VPSGIRPFRGTGDAVWSQVIYTMATRAAFRADPLAWYNDFWLPHFGVGVTPSSSLSCSSGGSSTDKSHVSNQQSRHMHNTNTEEEDATTEKMGHYIYQPNEGHEALAKLCHMFGTDRMNVITQNIDGLHQATRQPWNHNEQLIECHGRLGLSKCCPETDSDTDSHSSSDDDDDNDNDCIDPSLESNDSNDNKQKNNGENIRNHHRIMDENNDLPPVSSVMLPTTKPKKSKPSGEVARLLATTSAAPRRKKRRKHRPVKLGSVRKVRALHRALELQQQIHAHTEETKSLDATTNHDNNNNNNNRKETDDMLLGDRDYRSVCPYEITQSIPTELLEPPDVRNLLLGVCSDKNKNKHKNTNKNMNKNEDGGGGVGFNNDILPSAPLCPGCGKACLPQALLFDEGYHSHDFYQFQKMEQWMATCDLMVFVGTSFAVQVTHVALQEAKDRGIPVFNLNLESSTAAVETIVGSADQTLPLLLQACQTILNQQQQQQQQEQLPSNNDSSKTNQP